MEGTKEQKIISDALQIEELRLILNKPKLTERDLKPLAKLLIFIDCEIEYDENSNKFKAPKEVIDDFIQIIQDQNYEPKTKDGEIFKGEENSEALLEQYSRNLGKKLSVDDFRNAYYHVFSNIDNALDLDTQNKDFLKELKSYIDANKNLGLEDPHTIYELNNSGKTTLLGTGIMVDSNGMVSKEDQLQIIQNSIAIDLFNKRFPNDNSAQTITKKIDILITIDDGFEQNFRKNNITKSDITKALLILSCHESFSKPEDLIKLLNNVTDEKKRGDIDTFIKDISSIKEQKKDVIKNINPSNINQILAEESVQNRHESLKNYNDKPSTTISTANSYIESLQKISGRTSSDCIIF